MNVSQAVQAYLLYQNHLPAKTIDVYRDGLNRMIKSVGNVHISDLTRQHLAEVRADIKNCYAEGTVNYTASIIKAFLNFANESGWTTLKSSAIKKSRVAKKPKQVISESEFNVILAQAKTFRDKTILCVLWDTGVRVAELCAMTRDDLIDHGATIVRRKSLHTSQVYWSGYTEYMVRELIDTHEHPHLFVSKYGNPLDSRGVQRMIKGLNDRMHPHLFRHSKAYHMLHNGATLNDLKVQLGHTSVKTTLDNYGNWHDDIVRKRAMKFASPLLNGLQLPVNEAALQPQK